LTPFITKNEGIGGKIKQRTEDFIVGEIIDNDYILDPRMNNFELPGRKGMFLHFVLVKQDIDTSNALDWIAKLWNVPRNYISIAGLKDKKALTGQRASVWGINKRFEVGKIEEISLPKIKTKSLCLRLNEIRLGDLRGNFFDIIIRDIPFSPEETKKRIESCILEIEKKGGILNSFGSQRFGDIRPITHLVGKEIIKGNLREALRIYVGQVFEEELDETKTARELYWKTEDPKKTLSLLPKHLRIEKKILLSLEKRKNDYHQALGSLPLQFQKLFIHAYQSFLFNRYLTLRHEDYSENLDEPIEGEKQEDNVVYAPLIGGKTQLFKQTKEIYEQIFEEQEINLNDFQHPLIIRMGGKGTLRSISFLPKKTTLLEVSSDEINKMKTKARISFQIQKGSYATVLLREFIKNQ
jgi:tRNA pseudouridine13 synthase